MRSPSTPTTLASRTPVSRLLHRVGAFFVSAPSGADAYLSEATDIGDLERRMREVERSSAADAGLQLRFLTHARH